MNCVRRFVERPPIRRHTYFSFAIWAGDDSGVGLGRKLLRRIGEEVAVADRKEFEFGLGPRAFTLKELVRLLGSLPTLDAGTGPEGLVDRVEAAQAARAHHDGPVSRDNDIADPLGQPIEAYRAIAWEIETWMVRLVDGLFGPAVDSASADEGA